MFNIVIYIMLVFVRNVILLVQSVLALQTQSLTVQPVRQDFLCQHLMYVIRVILDVLIALALLIMSVMLVNPRIF